MNKYILITILLSLSLISCSKNVSIDGVNIDTSSGVKVSTEDGTIEATEDGAKISTEDGTLEMDGNGATATSGENSASIGNDGVSVTDGESTMDATSTGMQLNGAEGNINMDANGMTSDIEGVGKMSITNTGTKVGDIDLSKGTDNLIETSLNSEMGNILEDSANEAESME